MKNNRKTSRKRRDLIKGMAVLPFAGPISVASGVLAGSSKFDGYLTEEARAALQEVKGVLPKGKLGKHEISRLVLGCNPMGGWSHARDLRYVGQLSKRWHTDEKMKETWAIAEQAGINTVNLERFQYPVFSEFKKETGSRLLNIRQCNIGQPDDYLAPVREAVDLGADIIYIQGQNADRLYRTNALDVLQSALEYVHAQGLLFGIGAHSIQTILRSRTMGIQPDFYYKTFHHDNYWSATPREYREELVPSDPGTVFEGSPPGMSSSPEQGTPLLPGAHGAVRVNHNSVNDNMWDLFPEQTIEAFRAIDVPLFGFKVMAAGAIRPEDGIRWAFENGADFVCAGMYDFQVVEDVNTTLDILALLGERKRPWCA